jgi:hypothetical protein
MIDAAMTAVIIQDRSYDARTMITVVRRTVATCGHLAAPYHGDQ